MTGAFQRIAKDRGALLVRFLCIFSEIMDRPAYIPIHSTTARTACCRRAVQDFVQFNCRIVSPIISRGSDSYQLLIRCQMKSYQRGDSGVWLSLRVFIRSQDAGRGVPLFR